MKLKNLPFSSIFHFDCGIEKVRKHNGLNHGALLSKADSLSPSLMGNHLNISKQILFGIFLGYILQLNPQQKQRIRQNWIKNETGFAIGITFSYFFEPLIFIAWNLNPWPFRWRRKLLSFERTLLQASKKNLTCDPVFPIPIFLAVSKNRGG